MPVAWNNPVLGAPSKDKPVAAVCSNRSVMHISTFVVAFLRPIWSMGPSDLPGGPNTNVGSPLANQVHSMTLCAMQAAATGRAAARKRPHPTPLRTRRRPTDPTGSLGRDGPGVGS